MNEELEPLGMPESGVAPKSDMLRDFVAEHPVAALALSAAVGAGVAALVSAAARSSRTGVVPTDSGQAYRLFEELRHQLSKITDQMSSTLPDKATVAQTVSDLGAQAATRLESASDAAKRAAQSVIATGSKAGQAVADHPLLTSLIIGAVGAVAAAIAAQQSAASASEDTSQPATEPFPNGHDSTSAVTGTTGATGTTLPTH